MLTGKKVRSLEWGKWDLKRLNHFFFKEAKYQILRFQITSLMQHFDEFSESEWATHGLNFPQDTWASDQALWARHASGFYLAHSPFLMVREGVCGTCLPPAAIGPPVGSLPFLSTDVAINNIPVIRGLPAPAAVLKASHRLWAVHSLLWCLWPKYPAEATGETEVVCL